jgi:hypothetical protein
MAGLQGKLSWLYCAVAFEALRILAGALAVRLPAHD